jgi:limonene-1,2-epoxide hydrolase
MSGSGIPASFFTGLLTLSERLEKFLAFYNSLSGADFKASAAMPDLKTTPAWLRGQALYHEDIRFIDPVHHIEGRMALLHYLAHGYERVIHCQFTPITAIEQSEMSHLSWRMELQHHAIGNGKAFTVDGCSVLQWHDTQIIAHRDYYDLTDMVYQHLPVLGWVTHKIKQKMAEA